MSERCGWIKTENGWDHRNPRISQIIFQIRGGRPLRLIAEQFNVTIQRVSAIRRRAEIPKRYVPR